MKRAKLKNKQVIMFLSGLLAFVIGSGILAVYGFRHISRELHRQKLMQENVVIEIADLNIKAPVLEGIDNDTLSIAAGHFTGTGKVGSGKSEAAMLSPCGDAFTLRRCFAAQRIYCALPPNNPNIIEGIPESVSVVNSITVTSFPFLAYSFRPVASV